MCSGGKRKAMGYGGVVPKKERGGSPLSPADEP